MHNDKQQQIRQTHAGFICGVVKAAQNPDARSEIEQGLRLVQQNGWGDIVRVVREIFNGKRDESLLVDLDEEDAVIIRSILQGIQDPSTLPDPTVPADAAAAAPGLAGIIHAAAHGDTQALQAIGMMAEQMQQAGGPMAQVAGRFRQIMDGERNADVLVARTDASAESLILNILEELAKLDIH